MKEFFEDKETVTVKSYMDLKADRDHWRTLAQQAKDLLEPYTSLHESQCDCKMCTCFASFPPTDEKPPSRTRE